MCRATASTSAGSQSKSGNPCDKLIAPVSAASCDITVKMVVPTAGSFDVRFTVSFSQKSIPPKGGNYKPNSVVPSSGGSYKRELCSFRLQAEAATTGHVSSNTPVS